MPQGQFRRLLDRRGVRLGEARERLSRRKLVTYTGVPEGGWFGEGVVG